ncbi:hypothetical protein HNV11_13105 [Spirosoma taeanense]|uniref:Uncharacterized protein n=1 Tax=Spirosoma taeanense TaxID=2735870 RepID=A0A6M5YA47_9BACT|nr:hypothetical protein [Spirosoma taeanense]QJW90246.1 hypothetical protein HNV11_13105 [Spirosoma taeanense]
MQIVIEVADTKADFVLELLESLPFVAIQANQSAPSQQQVDSNKSLSPKTARLLGTFPQLASQDDKQSRQQAILAKHAR